MSQHNYSAIIRQLQEQLAAQQAQIQALLAGRATERRGEGEGATKIAKLQIFDSMSSKVARFISVCKLYVRMNLKKELVEGQVQWILLYMQGGSVDV